MKKQYNRAVEIPLLLELLSRLRTELSGKLDTRMITINQMLYSIAEALKYYDLKKENIPKIVESATKSYLYKQQRAVKTNIMVKKYAEYLLKIVQIVNNVKGGKNAKE